MNSRQRILQTLRRLHHYATVQFIATCTNEDNPNSAAVDYHWTHTQLGELQEDGKAEHAIVKGRSVWRISRYALYDR